MKIMETVGMMSTGGIVALGVAWFAGAFGSDTVPTEPEAPAVTRAATSDMTGVGPVTQDALLSGIAALGADTLSQSDELTPMQEAVIDFFVQTARQMNSTLDSGTGVIQFSNLTVQRLNVTYYFRVAHRFDELNPGILLQNLTPIVHSNLCNDASVRQIMAEHGFVYSYRYVSSDGRYLGQIQGTARDCA